MGASDHDKRQQHRYEPYDGQEPDHPAGQNPARPEPGTIPTGPVFDPDWARDHASPAARALDAAFTAAGRWAAQHRGRFR